MSITRLMWTNLCLLEEAEQQMRRDARAVRAGGATDEWWKANMRD